MLHAERDEGETAMLRNKVHSREHGSLKWFKILFTLLFLSFIFMDKDSDKQNLIRFDKNIRE